jgi:hypothetical protein
MYQRFVSLTLVALTSACSSLLPVSQSNSSSFKSFDEARSAVVALVPMKTSKKTVNANGIDFAKQPNTKILTHSEIVRLLVPAGLLKRDDLDPGILVCVQARDACNGLDIVAYRIAKTRTGNFFADFVNYRQRTETTGWRFNALILYVDDLVVYRSWGGQPQVDELDESIRPLGPFQDIGPSMVSGAR